MVNWLERARREIAEHLSPGAQAHVGQVAAESAETQSLQASQIAEETAALVSPAGLCPVCRCGQWWQLTGKPWYCRACKPDMPLKATTLTLPSHEPRLGTVPDPENLRRNNEAACQGLSITPE